MEDLNNNDPSNWKWGVIYYNKNDKRIFVPKKSPRLGWTLNAGNRYAILTLVAILVMIWFLLLSENGI